MSQLNALLCGGIAAALVLSQAARGEPVDRSLDTVIVTAQKREQSLQDVPLAVTAVSAELLRDTGVRDIKDLTILTPGLIITSTTSEANTTARIRGIGTVGDNAGLESSVGVVIDGVYRPRTSVGLGDLGEIERIEVLKGPQGTLFGKNTSAGVINVVTKKPSREFGAELELSGGNYGALGGSAAVTGPLGERLAGRLFVAAQERDGFLDITTGPGPRTEDEDGDRNYYVARGQLLFEPSETLDIRLVADYTERDEHCCAGVQAMLSSNPAVLDALNSTVPGSIANPADAFARRAFSNWYTDHRVEDLGTSVEINWDTDAFGGATLTSITAWRDWEILLGQDADFTTADILHRDRDGSFGTEFRQTSQELRLAGDTGRLNWLVGAFYADENLDSRNQLAFGSQFQEYFSRLLGDPALIGALTGLGAGAYPGGEGQRDVFDHDSESWALFTNNSLALTEAFELTLGLRYTNESKDLRSRYSNDGGAVGCQALRQRLLTVVAPGVPAAALPSIYGIGCAPYADPIFNDLVTSQSFDEDEWSGTAKLAWHFAQDAMAYLSFARGYKASGFNLDRERAGSNVSNNPAAPPIAADPDTRFNKEMVDSWELGLKTQSAGGSLIVNGAIFHQDYTDFQLNTFTGISFVVTSIPQVISQGVDLDLAWQTPLAPLRVQAGLTYADTKIDDFGAARAFFSAARRNDRPSFAPEWSGTVSATFERPVGERLLLRANVGAKYTSEYNTGSNLDPRKLQDAFTLVNARLGIGSRDSRWTLELWSQNLTDEDYYQVAFDATLQSGTIGAFLGAPRTWGATARFSF